MRGTYQNSNCKEMRGTEGVYNIYKENHGIFNIPSSQTNLEKEDSSSGLVKMSAI